MCILGWGNKLSLVIEVKQTNNVAQNQGVKLQENIQPSVQKNQTTKWTQTLKTCESYLVKKYNSSFFLATCRRNWER